jgi:eukaryotic-like serine/threonine-protein kinase
MSSPDRLGIAARQPQAISIESAKKHQQIRKELETVRASRFFRNADRMSRFLSYVVDLTLEGKSDELKEYSIAIAVFDRESSFDPRIDPIVRVEARRLRKKLDEYYEQEGTQDPVRIRLPKGSYAAEFAEPGSVPDSTPEQESGGATVAAEGSRSRLGKRHLKWIAAAVAATGLVAAGVLRLAVRPRPALSATDMVLISDFLNKTGDPVFDDTLKQAVSVELAQSPFLNIVSDERVDATLKLMTEPPDTRLTPEVARELCQRAGARAYIAGSISTLGSQYVIGLKAINCQTGDSLAQEQAAAEGKERVLKALDQAATRMRERLGESLSSIQKFDTPLDQATTPSLEALKAYSLGQRTPSDAAAVPFFKRAIELDPDFALAYGALGITYSNLDEPGQASENVAKAYELRERSSEREKLGITADYYQVATGELEKTNQTCELWTETYPRDHSPHNLLGVNYEFLGQYEKAVAENLEAIRLNPDSAVLYSNLMEDYAALDRVDAAKTTYQQAVERQRDNPFLHADRYGVAFLESDRAEMAQQMTWAAGKPEAEDWLLSLESGTQAFSGHFAPAREFSRRAVESAAHGGQKETAALWQMSAALREAEAGNLDLARQGAKAALATASTRDVETLAALALARADQPDAAQKMADALARRFPLNTVINYYWLPTIRAAIEIDRNHPARAIEVLQAAAPYELGYPNPQFGGGLLYPAYVRGQAYLLLRRGREAAAEFQKFPDHRGVVENGLLGALARLGLARAWALEGDAAKSRAAYQDFFTLWKDADSDLPILRQARTEYAKLS